MESKLSRRQKRAIPLIVAAPTIMEGCKAAGIAPKTYYQWMKNPLFQEEFSLAQSKVIEEAMGVLRGNIGGAVVVLVDLLKTDNEVLRRLVANDIVTHTIKMRELQDIEGRLASIERLVLERETYH